MSLKMIWIALAAFCCMSAQAEEACLGDLAWNIPDPDDISPVSPEVDIVMGLGEITSVQVCFCKGPANGSINVTGNHGSQNGTSNFPTVLYLGACTVMGGKSVKLINRTSEPVSGKFKLMK